MDFAQEGTTKVVLQEDTVEKSEQIEANKLQVEESVTTSLENESSAIVSIASPFETKEETSAMGDTEITSCQQTSDGHDNSTVGREGSSDRSRSPSPTIMEVDVDIPLDVRNCDYDEDDDVFSSPSVAEPELFWKRNKPTKDIKKSNYKGKILSTVREELNDDEEFPNDENDEEFNEDYENVNNRTRSKRDPKEKGSTKVVVRRLPPKMKRQEFIDAVSPLPEHDYLVIDNPDTEWGSSGRSIAHINFLDEDDALWFIDRFTNYQFIDEDGEEYVAICDFAMIPRVFFPLQSKTIQNCNPLRGTLEKSEEYQEFLNKYNENPFQFAGPLPNPDPVTTEMMLEEIENRPKKSGPIATPLLEYIMNKKIRREEERRIRKEKEREMRERNRQEKAKRERDRERDKDRPRGEAVADKGYRELKHERRRERREKERKDRRERERLEKEAKLKGMTVTYSKSGKVTRWSANSSPFLKSDENIDMASTSSEKPAEEIKNGGNKKDTTGEKEKSTPISKSIKPLMETVGNKEKESFKDKPKPRNPFSKDGKPPTHSDEKDKSRFGKPFPGMKDVKRSNTSNTNNKHEDNVEKDKTKSQVPFSSATAISSSSTEPSCPKDKDKSTEVTSKTATSTSASGAKVSKDEDSSKPKKKIIKKIIRVRKVRKPEEEGTAGDSSEKSDTKSNSSNSKGLSKPTTKPKPTTDKDKSNPNPSASATSSEPSDANRRRKVRPDMQIYRPGSLRKDSSTTKERGERSTPKCKTPCDNEAPDTISKPKNTNSEIVKSTD